MTETIGNMIEKYRDAYGLHGLKGDLPAVHHDAVHAMTGLGIGGLDEARLSAVIAGIINKLPEVVVADHGRNIAKMRSIFTGNSHDYHSDFSPFESRKTAHAFTHAQELKAEELVSLHALGRLLGERLEEKLGVRYGQARPENIMALHHADFDISEEVQRIKQTHETPINRRVERVVSNMLGQSSLEKTGGSGIPAYGQSWKDVPHPQKPKI